MKIKKSKITEEEREAYRLVGRRGGNATAKKGKRYMSKIGKAGANKRWGNDDSDDE